jgi:HlyD family secretion protein
MVEESKEMFRESALEQLSSPEQLDQLLRVTDRKSWLPLGTVGVAIVAVLIWSVFGQIPITVDGVGILIYPRRVVSFQSPAPGQIVSLDIQVGDSITKGRVIGRLNQPDISGALEQERVRLVEAELRDVQVGTVRKQRLELEQEALGRKRELLLARITSLQDMAEAQKVRQEGYLKQQAQNLAKLRTTSTALGETLEERYQSYQRLQADGLSSQDAVLSARQRFVDNRVQRADIELRAQEIELNRVKAEGTYRQQLEQISDLETQLQELNITAIQLQQQRIETKSEHEHNIQEIKRRIERYERELEGKGTIVSEYSGRILEIAVRSGQIVSAGQLLGVIEAEDLDSELIAAAYLPVSTGKKITQGMDVRVSPSTVERERYGSIVGTAVSISPFPVTREAVTTVVGNQDVANQLTEGGARIQVFSDLSVQPDTETGYQWTSGGGPPGTITAGTTIKVRATVEYRRPITFVIPILRSWSGI